MSLTPNFRADLHTHSFFSDGSDSPEQLIDLALEKQLQGLSITDHDTLQAYLTALPYAEKKGLLLLPGVEFSAHLGKESVHILCYAFPLASPEIQKLCAWHQLRREERNKEMLAKLHKLGITITEAEIAQNQGTIGRPHIALQMVKKGVVSSVKEAFHKYLGEGKSAYVEGKVISVEETLTLIRQGGGKAVLAHPMLIQRKNVLKKLLDMPFDGMEGYYAEIHAREEAPFIAAAEKKGWLITGGSDYHGAIKPHNPLGCSWVGEATFRQLYDHYLKTL